MSERGFDMEEMANWKKSEEARRLQVEYGTVNPNIPPVPLSEEEKQHLKNLEKSRKEGQARLSAHLNLHSANNGESREQAREIFKKYNAEKEKEELKEAQKKWAEAQKEYNEALKKFEEIRAKLQQEYDNLQSKMSNMSEDEKQRYLLEKRQLENLTRPSQGGDFGLGVTLETGYTSSSWVQKD